jgi:hypothetical protein
LSYGHHHCQGTRLKFESLFANKGLDFLAVSSNSRRRWNKDRPPRWRVVAPRHRMKRAGAALIVLFFFIVGTGDCFGQGDDPSEIFLKAYLSAQQGEKLERQDRFKTALAKYRFAGSLIEELRKSHGQWQPAVVEYRGRKISEAILRLQERLTRQTQLNASASPLPDIAPAAPESNAWSEPGPEALAPQPSESVNERPRDTAIKGATKSLRDKVAELQAALDKTRGDLETARKEKGVVDTRLNETNSKLEQLRTISMRQRNRKVRRETNSRRFRNQRLR